MSPPHIERAPYPAERRRSDQSISIVDLFTIGIGPSSSHTVGPMRAAALFAELAERLGAVAIRIDLYGSLALTGRGHATDSAVMLGLTGETPEGVDPDSIPARLSSIRDTGRMLLNGVRDIGFEEVQHLLFHPQTFLPGHPNALTFTATLAGGGTVERTWYSIGGGAIVEAGTGPVRVNIALPRPFSSGAELLATGVSTGLPSGCRDTLTHHAPGRSRIEAATSCGVTSHARASAAISFSVTGSPP